MLVNKQWNDTTRLSMSSEIIVLDKEQGKAKVAPIENEDVFIMTAVDFNEVEKEPTQSSDEEVSDECKHEEKSQNKQRKRRNSLYSLRNIRRKVAGFLDNYSWIAGPMS